MVGEELEQVASVWMSGRGGKVEGRAEELDAGVPDAVTRMSEMFERSRDVSAWTFSIADLSADERIGRL
jgi:hypothetical protein